MAARRVVMLLCGIALSFFMVVPAHAEEMNNEDISQVSHDDAVVLQDEISSRSWHGYTLVLSLNTRTPEWDFDGNNIGVEMTCTASRNDSFTVTLYRIGSNDAKERVGSADLRYQGFSKATWTNVGPGTYFFEFEKKADGITVFSSDVAAYSWS